MGEVYRATDSVLERTVAVKLLADRFAREPESRARFQRRRWRRRASPVVATS